jgi:copper chaperone CopZ
VTGTATFQVAGMTCDHCANAVTEELGRLDGVSSVRVELVPAGTSVVTVACDQPLDWQAIAAALEEAGGYRLADSAGV